MAYEPKTWVCGETITADALNNIETGVQEALECCEGGGSSGGGTLVIGLDHVEDVGENNPNYVFDRTYSEVKDALLRGVYVTLGMLPGESGTVAHIISFLDGDDENAWSVSNNEGVTLNACSENGYLQTYGCDDKDDK